MSKTTFLLTTGPRVSHLKYCTKPNLKKSLLIKHRITEDVAKFMVELFFGSVIDFKAIPMAEVTTYMAGKTCMKHGIHIFRNYANINDNTEIDFATPEQEDIEPEFSFALFEAIISKYNPIKEFQFSKAVSYNDDEGTSIVFRVVKVINNQDQVVYWGDLSESQP